MGSRLMRSARGPPSPSPKCISLSNSHPKCHRPPLCKSQHTNDVQVDLRAARPLDSRHGACGRGRGGTGARAHARDELQLTHDARERPVPERLLGAAQGAHQAAACQVHARLHWHAGGRARPDTVLPGHARVRERGRVRGRLRVQRARQHLLRQGPLGAARRLDVRSGKLLSGSGMLEV